MTSAGPVVFVAMTFGVASLGGCGSDDTGFTPDGGADAGRLARESGTLVALIDASHAAAPSRCAAVSSLFAIPNQVNVGHDIPLNASGLDGNDNSDDVTLSWFADGSSGTLSATTGPSVAFHCTSAGATMIAVKATVTDGGASCPNGGSMKVAVTCTAP